MARYLKVLSLLCTLFVACSPPPPAEEASASSPVDEVITAHLAARGGKERIQALQSLRQAGTVSASGGRHARIVRELKRPGLFRLEFSYQGTTSVFAHDGTTGWQVAPMQGQFEPKMTSAEADAVAGTHQRDIEGSLVDWREKGHLVQLLGRETLPSGEAFQLEVTLGDGAIIHHFVDVETSLITQSITTRRIRGEQVKLVDDFSDFRETDGLVYPHVIETRVQDRPQVLRIVVEDVEIDPAIDDERFQFPE